MFEGAKGTRESPRRREKDGRGIQEDPKTGNRTTEKGEMLIFIYCLFLLPLVLETVLTFHFRKRMCQILSQ